jgi:hypothetical protein
MFGEGGTGFIKCHSVSERLIVATFNGGKNLFSESQRLAKLTDCFEVGGMLVPAQGEMFGVGSTIRDWLAG